MTCQISLTEMDDTMKQFQEGLIEVEIEAENFLLARHQVTETHLKLAEKWPVSCFQLSLGYENVIAVS